MNNVINIRDLTVAYDKAAVLNHISFSVPKASMTAIVGPNGAGKSTLLKSILNLIPILKGEITFDIEGEESFERAKKYIAYIPQNGAVNNDFPASVKDIVRMGRYGHVGWFSRLSKNDKKIADLAIEKVGMSTFADRQFNELSGGQQQRVFLARAIAQEASVYLLDEPFKGIDAKTEKIIVKILKEMQKNGKTIVVVHHALHTVSEYFDHVALINGDLINFGKVSDIYHEKSIKDTFLIGGTS